MDLFQLTRALVDIESITENELLVGEYLYWYLNNLAAEYRGEVETWPVAPNRFNVFAWWGSPARRRGRLPAIWRMATTASPRSGGRASRSES